MQRLFKFCAAVAVALPALSQLPRASAAGASDEWLIILPKDAAPPELTAADILQKAVAANHGSARITTDVAHGAHTFLLGTPTDNPAIASLITDKKIDLPHMPAPDPQDDSYLAQSLDGGQTVVLASSKPRGVLYAACDAELQINQLAELNVRMVPKFSLRIVTLPVEMTSDHPSAPAGPWSNFKDEPDNYSRFLNWCAHQRYNCVIAGVPDKFPPMHFIDYAKTTHPEAQQYAADKVLSNRQRFHANATLVHQYGMSVIINNFTLLAPMNYVRAHKEMQTPFLNIHASGLDSGNDWVGNLSWNNAAYKQFWVDSYRQMLKDLPDLDGLLMPFAEWVHSDDPATQKKGFVATAADFITTAKNLVTEERGDRGIYIQRDWYLVNRVKDVTYLPGNTNVFLDPSCPRVVISFKMAGFDAATTTPDPWMADYTKLGHGAVAWLRITDTENTRPLHWADVDFYREIVENCLKMGCNAASVASPIEELKRSADMGQFVMIDAVRNYLWGQPYTADDAVKELAQWYGPAAPHVYASLRHAGQVMTNYPKLVTGEYGGGDGITGHAVSLGTLSMIPGPIWKHVQRDAVGVVEYVTALRLPAADREKTFAQWKADHRITPPQLLDTLADEAAQCLAEIREAKKLSPNARSMDRMVYNALIVNHLAQAYRYHIMGALEFVVSGGDLKKIKEKPAAGAALADRQQQAHDDWANAFRQMATVAKATNDFVKTDREGGEVREEVYKNQLRDYDAALNSLGSSLAIPAQPSVPAGSVWAEGESFQTLKGWKKSVANKTTLFSGAAIASGGSADGLRSGPIEPGQETPKQEDGSVSDRASTTIDVPDGSYLVWARTLGYKAADMSFSITLTSGGTKLKAQGGMEKPYREAYTWSELGKISVAGGKVDVELAKTKLHPIGLDAMLFVPASAHYEPPEARTNLEPSADEVHAALVAEFGGQPVPEAPKAQQEIADLEKR